MRIGLRFLAIGVPILLSLAANVVLAAPGKMTTKIELPASKTYSLVPPQSDIVRLFTH